MFSGPEESAFIWSGVELFISSFSRDGRAIAQAEEGTSQTIFKFVNDEVKRLSGGRTPCDQ